MPLNVMVQVLVDAAHPPPQPANADCACGVAVNVTGTSCGSLNKHVDAVPLLVHVCPLESRMLPGPVSELVVLMSTSTWTGGSCGDWPGGKKPMKSELASIEPESHSNAMPESLGPAPPAVMTNVPSDRTWST
jgi:hypothetical protein